MMAGMKAMQTSVQALVADAAMLPVLRKSAIEPHRPSAKT